MTEDSTNVVSMRPKSWPEPIRAHPLVQQWLRLAQDPYAQPAWREALRKAASDLARFEEEGQ